MIKDLLKSAFHPTEVAAMFQLKFSGKNYKYPNLPLEELALKLNDIEFCYAALNRVSRSFSTVIHQLPEELRDAVCLFYLILRGLDSVEDDMSFPNEEKLPLLRTFYEKCFEDDCTFSGIGESHNYNVLLQNFDKVTRSFKNLDKKYQAVIADICRKMGNGMADFADQKINTVQDYDLYCHYAAGLVGHGLSALFSASGLEDPELKFQKDLSNSMGLFLQKTNIIRDYNEDLFSSRTFWPKEIWQKYAGTLEEFKNQPFSQSSLACLNLLVTDALQHIPDCLSYLKLLKNKQVFRFCAIPQVMAIGTLAKVYNNPKVFQGVVKIRKGLAAKMLLYSNNMETIYEIFEAFACEILLKANPSDPNYKLTKERLQFLIEMIGKCQVGKSPA